MLGVAADSGKRMSNGVDDEKRGRKHNAKLVCVTDLQSHRIRVDVPHAPVLFAGPEGNNEL